MDVMEALALALPVLSLALYGLMMISFVWAMRRRRRESSPLCRDYTVSILKPLAGDDDELAQNLESFATLTGARYELLLGVASTRDPAFAVARRFVDAHPEIDATLIVTSPDAAINPKVAQLVALERIATGDVLVVSDANIRVRPDYLRGLLSEIDRGAGLVSSVISGTGERTTGAALENLIIAAHVAPGVVASHALTGKVITIGKSMAMTRAALATIGGFAAVGDVLAEDHVISQRMHRAGVKVGLSLDPVDNVNATCTTRRSLERHTRWAKIRRAMVPMAFPLEPLAMPVVVALLSFALTRTSEAAALVFVASFAQLLGSRVALSILRGRGLSARFAPLEIFRSGALLFCWLVAWTSRTVVWRGNPLRIGAGTRLERLTPHAALRTPIVGRKAGE